MFQKIRIIIYYVFYYNLPHSRYVSIFTKMRVWYLAKILKVMPYCKKSKVENGVYISNTKGLKIGKNCRINENVFIQEAVIGDNVLIAPNVSILSVSHNHSDLSIPIVDQGDSIPSPPIIEDNVWLARNVIIMPGITIGTGAIVGAGAVVTKNVKSNTIVGGVPAKYIKDRV